MLSRFNARRLMTSLIATVSVLAGVLTATPSVANAAVRSHTLAVTYVLKDTTTDGAFAFGDAVAVQDPNNPYFSSQANLYDCASNALDDPTSSSDCVLVSPQSSTYRIGSPDNGKYLVAVIPTTDPQTGVTTLISKLGI